MKTTKEDRSVPLNTTVPEEVHKSLRLATAHTGETMRDLILEGLEPVLRKRSKALPYPLPWPKAAEVKPSKK